MNGIIYLLFGIMIFIVLLIAVAFFVTKKEHIQRKDEKFPEGHFLGMGMGIGMPIGMVIGIIYGIIADNMPLGISFGPAIGAGLGVGIGIGIEKKNEHKIRPLTKKEHTTKRQLKTIIVGIALLGVIILGFFLLR